MFRSFLFDHPQGATCRALCRYYTILNERKSVEDSIVTAQSTAYGPLRIAMLNLFTRMNESTSNKCVP